MRHTPGPWRISNSHGLYVVAEIRGHASVVADLDETRIGTPRPQAEANAMLIAAAPDLLFACKAVLARLENPMLNTSLFCDNKADLRKAIAKAEGRATP